MLSISIWILGIIKNCFYLNFLFSWVFLIKCFIFRVKFKNGGWLLWDKLDKIGFSFLVGCRKVVNVIFLMLLVEGE